VTGRVQLHFLDFLIAGEASLMEPPGAALGAT
jgi:hypothetical protein